MVTTVRRPFGVTIAVIYCLVSTAWSLAAIVFAYSDHSALQPELAGYFESQTILDRIVVAVGLVCTAVGGISLFRLRRSAVPLLTMAAIASATDLCIQLALRDAYSAIGRVGVITAVFFLIALSIIAIYAWTLNGKEILVS